ncbi:MAG: phenylalanine--tRNA ligase subunit beta [Clostridia bacterium]|nr:phenylalanine--tRNA ligase subunit beta [Clostridia bacterium]
MKLPVNWLNEYVDTKNIKIKDYCDAMTMSGSKVEGYETACGEITNVVIGKIEKIERHPDADKLQICQINVGDEVLQIVTGAQNVFEGAYIPVAKVGARLVGGFKISKGKLRGVESNGMLCSEEEIGININGEKSTGIMILDGEPELGADFVEYYGLKEDIVEFEITSNRPDCLGVLGLARETAATFDLDFKKPEGKFTENGENISDYLKVSVLNTEKCERYAARVVKNVKIEPSPLWLQRRLNRAGVRSINNIVDITNYVMLEYGRPMHAFDIKYVAGNEIIVRDAKKGEKIVTLDGIERELDESVLVIADSEKPSAVAGVMGGEYSGVTDDTTTIVFESANFNGPSTRRTSQKLGLRTESSGRYEKGLDAEETVPALNRALELVEMLGAGEIVGGMIDINNKPENKVVLPLEAERINNFIGMDVSKEEMIRILKKLDFEVENDMITAPSFRTDIGCFNDIAEEVARIYGYDKISSSVISGEVTEGKYTKSQQFENKIKTLLSDIGCYEIYTYSFTSPGMFDMLRIPEDSELRKVVKITNPLGEENSIMRTTTAHSVLEVLRTNYNHRVKDALVFETGNIYIPKAIPVTELPDEVKMLTIGSYGKYDFYDIKGIVEVLFAELGIKDADFEPINDNPTFHPYRTAKILDKDGNELGIMGEVHPLVAENYEIGEKAYICMLNLEKMLEVAYSEIKYKEMPKFPATTRDLAMLVDDDTMVSKLEKTIKKFGGKILEEVNLFDIYKGKQIPEGKKSVAYALSFRASDRTLTDEEVSASMNKILKNLQSDFNAELRM